MQNLENILISKQITPTPMRLLVLEFLLAQKSAVSLGDVETELNHSDRVTIYRTLKTFEEKGLIHDINDGSESIKYALCESDCRAGIHHDLHLHFYCTSCKQLFCLPASQIPEVTLPQGYQVHELSLVARGLCNTCSKNAISLHQQ